MRKKVYISGKIGEEVLSDVTRKKFAKAEELLKSKGYEVFNPTRSGFGKIADEKVRHETMLGHKTSWYAEVMKLDLMALSFCDTICMLADWTDSPGATVEYYFAKALGLEIIYKKWDKDE